MKNQVIIGMNYGDEGKGHITNYFSDAQTLNIRFNGGAQAAHGVQLSDGRSHIFHHFGSGSLRGARTLLTNKFIVNPIIFDQEFAELSNKTALREIFVDPRCLVTTPYDMLINSFASQGKHNTCGLGINETIERSVFRQLRIGIRDLADTNIYKILEKIRSEYVPYRLDKLNLSLSEFKEYFKKRVTQPERMIEQYISIIKFMLKHIVIWPSDNLIDLYLAKEPGRHLVFEGAQGLLLDQNLTEYMPFLTRSNTGLKNVLQLLRTVRTEIELDVYLVTRAYLTRHGDGPMFNEFMLPHENICELSNLNNPYQGSMRYGNLDHTWYKKAFSRTCTEIFKASRCDNVYVAMTCTDQVKIDLFEFDNIKLISKGPMQNNIHDWI